MNEPASDAMIDAFSGLPNRRALRRHLEESWRRAWVQRLPISLIAIDLDEFMRINEAVQAVLITGGDLVIAEAARLLCSLARAGDFVARDGGDQFCVIMPDTDGEHACHEANRIRLATAQHSFEVRNERVPVTASIGVATAALTDSDPWNLFLRARTAVHQAKASGRNQIAVG